MADSVERAAVSAGFRSGAHIFIGLGGYVSGLGAGCAADEQTKSNNGKGFILAMFISMSYEKYASLFRKSYLFSFR
ncbi:hypothetical protein [Leptolyngbya sp. 7M]|uniref:hypothetical protein n=1 Tax=Leptolyngbya sp. 7M TaxID=2812896 RepID=UPI001B8B1AA8|nr:hypothetical protein [Leptolyngbya sp. 7M]QYO67165.1 hypothetical protein JVX88_10385 [Leptolyngbya sp. 7M]